MVKHNVFSFRRYEWTALFRYNGLGISKYLASIRSLNTKNTLKQFFENHFNLAIRWLRILVHGDLNVVDGVPLCAFEAI